MCLLSFAAFGCSGDGTSPSTPTMTDHQRQARAATNLPREWTSVDRATPELEGRFGPHDWTLCKGRRPCVATTWSPVSLDAPRPTMTVLVTADKVWQTAPSKSRWQARWAWIDPLLAACLGDALSLSLVAPKVRATLVEHSDGFWWTYDLDGVGPCDLRGGIELHAAEDTGRSTKLTAGGNAWGSPAAVGYATDILHHEYGPAPGAAAPTP